MKIALVRHGETVYNQLGKIQGISNIPLSDEGRRQCQKLKERIKDKKYDVCFASPLIRTMETAMILVGDKVLINPDNRIIERNMGELEGKPREEYDYIKYWDYKLNCGEMDIEKIQDMFKRCEDFINYLKEKYNDKSILIVTHSATLRVLHHILNKTDLNKKIPDFPVDNCYYEEIEV